MRTLATSVSDGVPADCGDGHSGGAVGSNDPPLRPSQPKPDKSHIAGLSLPLDSLIPPAEQQQAPKRSHRGSVGQTKRAKWTKKDWCWAGWNRGANEAYQGFYGVGNTGASTSSPQQQAANTGGASSVAAAMPGPALPKQRPFNRAYTMPAAAIDAAAATMGATSKAAMPARPIGPGAAPTTPASMVPVQSQATTARPVGQSPHWSIPAPLLPHTPITPVPPSSVTQADERLAACDSAAPGAASEPPLRPPVQGQAPATPSGQRHMIAAELPPSPPSMPRSGPAEGTTAPPSIKCSWITSSATPANDLGFDAFPGMPLSTSERCSA